jgi:hypothetical protein
MDGIIWTALMDHINGYGSLTALMDGINWTAIMDAFIGWH